MPKSKSTKEREEANCLDEFEINHLFNDEEFTENTPHYCFSLRKRQIAGGYIIQITLFFWKYNEYLPYISLKPSFLFFFFLLGKN